MCVFNTHYGTPVWYRTCMLDYLFVRGNGDRDPSSSVGGRVHTAPAPQSNCSITCSSHPSPSPACLLSHERPTQKRERKQLLLTTENICNSEADILIDTKKQSIVKTTEHFWKQVQKTVYPDNCCMLHESKIVMSKFWKSHFLSKDYHAGEKQLVQNG